MKNYYTILGVPENCSQDEIKKAYRKLARKYHPDTSHENSSEQFRDIQEAYENIGTVDKRKNYDNRLKKFRDAHHQKETQNQSSYYSVESLFDFPLQFRHVFSNFPGFSYLGTLEIELTPEEAEFGTSIPVQMPVQGGCPRCHGRGYLFRGLEICEFCGGSGTFAKSISFVLNLPAGMKDGTRMMVNLPNLGYAEIKITVN